MGLLDNSADDFRHAYLVHDFFVKQAAASARGAGEIHAEAGLVHGLSRGVHKAPSLIIDQEVISGCGEPLVCGHAQ